MRYEYLAAASDEQPPDQEWLDALDVVRPLMALVEKGDAQGATKLLRSNLPNHPCLLACLIDTLVDLLGKPPRGAPKKNHDWYLLRIYDHYRSLRGTAGARLEQLATDFGLSVSTVEKLLKQGRKLGRKLAAEELEHESHMAENPYADEPQPDWDLFIARAASKRSGGTNG